MFKNFEKRLQKDIRFYTKRRLEENNALSTMKGKPIEVNVIKHDLQRYAVWFGGAYLASTAEFFKVAITKQQYEEVGTSIMRRSQIFSAAKI